MEIAAVDAVFVALWIHQPPGTGNGRCIEIAVCDAGLVEHNGAPFLQVCHSYERWKLYNLLCAREPLVFVIVEINV